jgi:hypothetical protein
MINPYSKISLWFCFVLMIWTGFYFYPRWNQSKTESTISWDVSGYYTLNAGEKKRIWLDAQCPEAFDAISISFWNAKSPNQIWIDDLSISTLE